MNVDRISRDRLVNAIHRFLNDETTAFQFDDEIHEIRAGSRDPTIRHVVCALWCHYDDCKDHHVVLCKEEWDYFQRLILLLKSDAHVKIEKRRIWSGAQGIAGLALAAFCLAAWSLGFGRQLLILSLPFGIVAIGIAKWRRREYLVPGNVVAMFPFASISEILRVRRQIAGFTKQSYRAELESRRIRKPTSTWIIRLQTGVVFLVFAPLMLFAHLFPDTETVSSVEG